MSERRYHVILNAHSGAAHSAGVNGAALADLFAANNLATTIDDDVDSPLEERVRKAIASGAEVVVAAGGDGTVTAIASAVVDSGQALGILPLGTVNALARDLGVPLDLAQAVQGLATMEPRQIDVGEVNGEVFLHKVVIGFIPGVAAAREQIRGRDEVGAKIGFLRYFHRRLTRARRMAVEIDYGDGRKHIDRVWAVAVASNAYDEGPGRFFVRGRLDQGDLTLYLLKRLSTADLVRLTAEMLLGNWHQDNALQIESLKAVTVRTKKTHLKAMVDGEVKTLEGPFVFRIRPLALTILTPVSPDQVGPDAPHGVAVTATEGS